MNKQDGSARLRPDKFQVAKQEDLNITRDNVAHQLRKMPYWKGPGPDGIGGYWSKNVTFLHECLAKVLDECVTTENVLDWMVEGRTIFANKRSYERDRGE